MRHIPKARHAILVGLQDYAAEQASQHASVISRPTLNTRVLPTKFSRPWQVTAYVFRQDPTARVAVPVYVRRFR